LSSVRTAASATALVMPPVCDCEGRPWPRVRVTRNELTCTGCGETTVEGRCPRCGVREDGEALDDAPALVRTLDYLREGEFEAA